MCLLAVAARPPPKKYCFCIFCLLRRCYCSKAHRRFPNVTSFLNFLAFKNINKQRNKIADWKIEIGLFAIDIDNCFARANDD